jgi:hypothetical protein
MTSHLSSQINYDPSKLYADSKPVFAQKETNRLDRLFAQLFEDEHFKSIIDTYAPDSEEVKISGFVNENTIYVKINEYEINLAEHTTMQKVREKANEILLEAKSIWKKNPPSLPKMSSASVARRRLSLSSLFPAPSIPIYPTPSFSMEPHRRELALPKTVRIRENLQLLVDDLFLEPRSNLTNPRNLFSRSDDLDRLLQNRSRLHSLNSFLRRFQEKAERVPAEDRPAIQEELRNEALMIQNEINELEMSVNSTSRIEQPIEAQIAEIIVSSMNHSVELIDQAQIFERCYRYTLENLPEEYTSSHIEAIERIGSIVIENGGRISNDELHAAQMHFLSLLRDLHLENLQPAPLTIEDQNRNETIPLEESYQGIGHYTFPRIQREPQAPLYYHPRLGPTLQNTSLFDRTLQTLKTQTLAPVENHLSAALVLREPPIQESYQTVAHYTFPKVRKNPYANLYYSPRHNPILHNTSLFDRTRQSLQTTVNTPQETAPSSEMVLIKRPLSKVKNLPQNYDFTFPIRSRIKEERAIHLPLVPTKKAPDSPPKRSTKKLIENSNPELAQLVKLADQLASSERISLEEKIKIAESIFDYFNSHIQDELRNRKYQGLINQIQIESLKIGEKSSRRLNHLLFQFFQESKEFLENSLYSAESIQEFNPQNSKPNATALAIRPINTVTPARNLQIIEKVKKVSKINPPECALTSIQPSRIQMDPKLEIPRSLTPRFPIRFNHTHIINPIVFTIELGQRTFTPDKSPIAEKAIQSSIKEIEPAKEIAKPIKIPFNPANKGFELSTEFLLRSFEFLPTHSTSKAPTSLADRLARKISSTTERLIHSSVIASSPKVQAPSAPLSAMPKTSERSITKGMPSLKAVKRLKAPKGLGKKAQAAIAVGMLGIGALLHGSREER